MSAEIQDDNRHEDLETAALGAEVDKLLEIWGVSGDGGRQKRKAARVQYDARKVHPGFIYTDNIKKQYLANLVICMRHFDAIRDDASLAAILATLLEAQNPENLKPQFRARQMAAQTLICEVLTTGYRMLRRQPGSTTYEQLQRLLRRAKPFQLSEEGKAAVGILLAQLMKEEGHSADAYDALLPLKPPSGSREEYQRRYLLAEIRHRQWTEAMQAAAAPKTRGPSQPTTASQQQSQQQEQLTFNSFTNNTQLWGRAGRNARDVAQEAQGHFEAAIDLQPEAYTYGAIALVEMAVSQGKMQEALQIARNQCSRAPTDADAHSMSLALLFSSRKTSKKSPVSNEEIMQRCTFVLQTNCGDSSRAVQVLIKLAKKLPDDALPPLIVFQGLCAYLDTTPPLIKLHGVTLKSWNMLSDCLILLSQIIINVYKTAKEAQDHLRQLERQAAWSRGHGSTSTTVEIDAAAEVMKATQLEFQHALRSYKAVQRVLQQRAWWQDCHLQLPKTASKLTRLVNEGTASIETLIPLSIVHSVQVHALESMNATRVKLDLAQPSSVFSTDRLATVVKTMQQVGAAEDARTSYLSNCKTVRLASTAVLNAGEDAVQSTALAAAVANVTAAFQQQDEEMDSDNEERTQPSWKPYPLGAPHPELGFISQLPETWWSVFPQKRREGRLKEKEPAGEEEEAAEEEMAALNNAQIGGTQQKRVRFNLPSTEVESAMDTD